MKKSKKTYAILHLTEKHTVFYLGKTKVHVSFTGGTVTKKGVTPATFTTDDPVVQLAIENSKDFKKGAITLKSSYPVDGDVKVGKNPAKVAEVRDESEEESEVFKDSKDLKDSKEDSEEREEGEAEGLEVVDASCKDVAKQYLQDHYGENPTPLRTRDDVQRCAAKYGITFNFV